MADFPEIPGMEGLLAMSSQMTAFTGVSAMAEAVKNWLQAAQTARGMQLILSSGYPGAGLATTSAKDAVAYEQIETRCRQLAEHFIAVSFKSMEDAKTRIAPPSATCPLPEPEPANVCLFTPEGSDEEQLCSLAPGHDGDHVPVIT